MVFLQPLYKQKLCDVLHRSGQIFLSPGKVRLLECWAKFKMPMFSDTDLYWPGTAEVTWGQYSSALLASPLFRGLVPAGLWALPP